jgi:hypothetical protein
MILGSMIFLFGLYRTQAKISPMQMLLQASPMIVVLSAMAVILFRADGTAALFSGFKNTLAMTARLLPVIVALFLVMGASAAITRYYEHQIEDMIAGKYGTVGALSASVITPSSSTLAPQVTRLWANKPLRGNLMIYLATCTQLSLSLLFFRNLGLNWNISGRMYAMGVIGSLLIIPVVRVSTALGFL